MTDRNEPVASGPRGRSGSASRSGRPTSTTPAVKKMRRTPAARPDTAAATPTTPPAVENVVPAQVPTTGPAGTRRAVPGPGDADVATSETRRLLEARLQALHPDTADQVVRYRPQQVSATDWAQVADLTRLGIATYAPEAPGVYKTNTMRTANWAFAHHAAFHLAAGTSRSVEAWYSHDAIDATLRSLADSERRSLGSHVRKLRAVSEALLPNVRQPQSNDRAYTPHGPYSTGDLESYLDHAAHHPKPHIGNLLATLIWVGVGTGAFDREMRTLIGTSFAREPLSDHYGVVTGEALVVDLPGDVRNTPARRVAVHHSCEAPMARLVAAAGEESLWPGLHHKRSVTETIARQAGIPDSLPNLTSGRLRATWLALMVGGDVPVTALLPAAGTKGDRSFGYLLDLLDPMPEPAYLRALRGTDGPLATLEGAVDNHPAPVIALRADHGGAR